MFLHSHAQSSRLFVFSDIYRDCAYGASFALVFTEYFPGIKCDWGIATGRSGDHYSSRDDYTDVFEGVQRSYSGCRHHDLFERHGGVGSFQRSNNDLSLMMTPSNLSGPVNGPGRKSDCAVPRFLHRFCFRDWNHNHYNSGDASSGRGQWGAAGLADYVVFFRAGRLADCTVVSNGARQRQSTAQHFPTFAGRHDSDLLPYSALAGWIHGPILPTDADFQRCLRG
jgi:hypothetical protein